MSQLIAAFTGINLGFNGYYKSLPRIFRRDFNQQVDIQKLLLTLALSILDLEIVSSVRRAMKAQETECRSRAVYSIMI
jgi:hypothetical protein